MEPSIYRFKFNQDFTEILSEFAKVHQYDDRKDFKEAWQKWSLEYEEVIEREIERLQSNGCKGDIKDKMFKSARYYYRKKTNKLFEPKERSQYIGNTKEFINEIDSHLLENIHIKPSESYILFCKNNTKIVVDEIKYFLSQNISEDNEIERKIKKTYKNRYFLLSQSVKTEKI
jgi:hypothetical protein